jgi:hypothetical protein
MINQNNLFLYLVANTVFFNARDIIELACEWYNCATTDLVKIFQQDKNGNSFLNQVLIGELITFSYFLFHYQVFSCFINKR